MVNAILAACALLAIGVWLRVNVRAIRALYVPGSVVGGLAGLLAVQCVSRIDAVPLSVKTATVGIASEFGSWPGFLIAVIFASLLLEGSSSGGDSFFKAVRRGARSGLLAWIIILGQIAIGLIVYLLAVKPFHPEVPAGFGQLLEVTWAGGHGASTAMAIYYEAQGFPAGRDLAFFLATLGLIYGVLSGLVFVNIAIRKRWTALPVGEQTPDEPVESAPAKRAKHHGLVEPLLLQLLILAGAVGIGLLLQQGFFLIAQQFLPPDDPALRGQTIDNVRNLPPFLFTLIGGGVLKWLLNRLGGSRLIDPDTLRRIVTVVMEFLIVSAVATMRLDAVSAFILPLILLVTLAAIWTGFCLLVLARKILPQAYWFELGLLNYGFSTANTPQGFMLLRIVDPHLRTRAAEDYAVAAPLTAPFVGGGVITFAGLPLMLSRGGASATLAVTIVVLLGLLLLARRLAYSR